MAKSGLVCHLLYNMKDEIGTVKAKKYAQEFSYKKRMWPIDKDAVSYTDRKGNEHYFCDINESDGIVRWLDPIQFNHLEFVGENKVQFLDKCSECGGRITYDARNVRDMLKRKTIDTFWGIDSSHIMLLLVMGIIAIGAFGGLFYLLGQNQNLQQQLNKYLPSAEEVKQSRNPLPNTVKAIGILGEIYN